MTTANVHFIGRNDGERHKVVIENDLEEILSMVYYQRQFAKMIKRNTNLMPKRPVLVVLDSNNIEED